MPDCSTLILALLAITATSNTPIGARAKTVVFYPPPTTSYMVYHTNVAGALAQLGHQVWLCLPHFMLDRNLVKDPNVHILDYGQQLGNLEAFIYQRTKLVDTFWAGQAPQEMRGMFAAGDVFVEIATQVLSDQTFVDKVRSLNPDLFVLESIPFNMNMIILPYMLGIPYALIGTFHDVVMSKVPFSPATNPMSLGRWSDRMSFLERVQSFLIYFARINFDLFYDSSLVTIFAPHKPYKSINELASAAEIFIAEIDHILDYPRVTMPNTKLIGGSSASPAKPLKGEFQIFANESQNGIVVVSFGGSIVNLPERIAAKMAAAFQQLNLEVVWKVNYTSPDPGKILTSTWIPQNDLLGHEKTKLFISHCGKNGQYEALYHGVPILCLPIYGDQGYNSERVVVKQLGLQADIREVSADEFAGLIRQLVFTGNYSDNMKRASSLYRELYRIPMKEAAYWLDHTMRYGGRYMRSAGQEMSWLQLFVLDVMAFLAVLIGSLIAIVYLAFRQCYKIYRSNIEPGAKVKKQ